jgi:hypothetical protein
MSKSRKSKTNNAAHAERIAYWQPIVKKFQKSNLSIRQFCQQQQLPIHKFRYWLYRVPEGGAKAGSPPTPSSEALSFLPMEVTEAASPVGQSMNLQCEWQDVRMTLEVAASGNDKFHQLMSMIGGWYAESSLRS